MKSQPKTKWTKIIWTNEKFIAAATTVHKNKFDYSESEFKTYSKDKIIIRCIEHNKKYSIIPWHHIRNKNGGCCDCGTKYYNSIVSVDDIVKSDGEIFKDVPIEEFKDNYYISNLGRCINKKTGKSIGSNTGSGYERAQLCNNGNIKSYNIHELVYKAFGGEHPEGNVISHKNGDMLNNKLTNLQSASRSENIKNAFITNPTIRQHQNIVQMFDLNGIFQQEFNNVKEATIFLERTSTSGVIKCLQKKLPYTGGHIFRYKDENVFKGKQSKLLQNIDDCVPIGKIDDIDFPNYVINKKGDVINTYNNKNRKIAHVEDDAGYIQVGLCGIFKNVKKQKLFLLHRLIAKYFLKDGNMHFNGKKLVVNHKNGNRKDNSTENLEWVTQEQNVIHALGKRVVQMDKTTGRTIKIYNTIKDACIKLNLKKSNEGHISEMCKNNPKTKSVHNFKWRYATKNDIAIDDNNNNVDADDYIDAVDDNNIVNGGNDIEL